MDNVQIHEPVLTSFFDADLCPAIIHFSSVLFDLDETILDGVITVAFSLSTRVCGVTLTRKILVI